MDLGDLRVNVTNDDVRAARAAWLAARDGDAAPARADQLLRGYEHVVRAQAQQMAEEFRAARA